MPVKQDPALRFWEKVDILSEDDCWEWIAHRNESGYGTFHVTRSASPVRAHRFAYESLVGPIPAGLVLDHLCSVRHCVNPDHLEPVTLAENTRRGGAIQARVDRNEQQTHCKREHEFTPENTYTPPGTNFRVCRTCKRDYTREYLREWRSGRRDSA